MATEPYLDPEDGMWCIDKDPNDKRYYRYNLTKDLLDSGTTAVSVSAIVAGVTVLEEPIIDPDNPNHVIVKLGGLDTAANAENFCTIRTVCANTEEFDRTIKFKRQEN